jgi:acyl-CoA synthetase (AMP-forming)/AMP-acid ligase II
VTPRTLSVPSLLQDNADQYGDRTFLIDRDVRVSFAQLRQQTLALAERLRDSGVSAGGRVVILLPNWAESVVAQFGVITAGAVAVPLNIRMRADELTDVLRTLEPQAVIFTELFLTNDIAGRLEEAMRRAGVQGRLPALQVRATTLRPWAQAYERPAPGDLGRGDGAPEADAPEADASQAMVCYWTSGTTGPAKGVLHRRDLLENVVNWTGLLGYEASDVIVATRPFYYISGSCWALLGALVNGCTLVLSDTLAVRDVLALMLEHGGTVMLGGPSVYLQLMDLPELAAARPRLRLKKGFFGGEPIRAGFVERVAAELGVRRLVQSYGMTELQGFASSTDPDDLVEVTETTVGRPLPGFTFSLRSADGEPVDEPGAEGELWVRGRIFAAYVRSTGMDPGKDPDGWFHTGDRFVRWPDGRWSYRGRLRDVAKVKGESVWLGEIDAVIETMPDVRRCVCVVLEQDDTGDVIACVVEQATGAAVSGEAVREHCRGRLAPFKVPPVIRFAPAGYQWPTTVSGKVPRGEVRTWWLETQGPHPARKDWHA